jgi:hypothetical protein
MYENAGIVVSFAEMGGAAARGSMGRAKERLPNTEAHQSHAQREPTEES